MTTADNVSLSIPPGIGIALVRSASFFACPPLTRADFCTFCTKRGISLDRDRLLRWERLGMIRPVFRVATDHHLAVPLAADANPFDSGGAIDTTSSTTDENPGACDHGTEAFYSMFQVDEARIVLADVTAQLPLDKVLESSQHEDDLRVMTGRWLESARHLRASGRVTQRAAIALLCQAISNRYYPLTQSDGRRQRVTAFGTRSTARLSIDTRRWDWHEFSRTWNPQQIETLFGLTAEKLEHAYDMLAGSQRFIDPLQHWHELVQFVAIDMRRALKGDALLAQTLREGALMLRRLHRDLYGVDLTEVDGTPASAVLRQAPVSDEDSQRRLEFAANRFGVNPQPHLVLMLEGRTEVHAVRRILDEVFGLQARTCGIELLDLNGVSGATGGKQDRYQAIFRLVDYLHHHQTLAVLILDNEGQAGLLRRKAKDSASTYGHRDFVMRPDAVHVWRRTFEFDNFTDTELAQALTALAPDASFTPQEVAAWRREPSAGAMLEREFKARTGDSLPKLKLFDHAFDALLVTGSREAVLRKPIVRKLKTLVTLALRNPFPTEQDVWVQNQASHWLSKKRKPPRPV